MALQHLGYNKEQIAKIVEYVVGSATLNGAPHVNRDNLKLRGFTDEVLDTIEDALPTAFDINYVFNRYVVGDAFLTNGLKIPREVFERPEFNHIPVGIAGEFETNVNGVFSGGHALCCSFKHHKVVGFYCISFAATGNEECGCCYTQEYFD